ncbi:MAG TPA: TldD/PmbA family protein [Acidimicrobiales bacterium]|nr:TldD/PmbA family protein [Acidimicrobiales bacterium]
MTGPAGVAEQVLALVGRQGTAEARVLVTRHASALTRFANSFIHQNVADETTVVTVDVALDGRTAGAVTNRTDRDALAEVVERALQAARVRPVDPKWPGLAPPQPAPVIEHFDEATAGASPDRRAAVVAAFVSAGEGLSAAGYCETSGLEAVLANSAGQHLSGRRSVAILDAIHRDGQADGIAVQASVSIDGLDGAAMGAIAARKARHAKEPVELPPGRYPVVLEPRCLADMLDGLAYYGFNARSVEEGQSFARIGEAQFDPAISLWDDATDPRAVGLLFDHEGTPKGQVPLVSEGTVVGLAHDRRTAKAIGASSTGHAIPGGEMAGAIPTNLFIGDGASSADELIAGVDRGLLVSDFWYTRVLDPKTLVMTGLTRNGVFLIEDGRLGRAVGNLRFTQSYVAALGPGNVVGVGSDGRLVSTIDYIHHAPTLSLRSWNFTGNARG